MRVRIALTVCVGAVVAVGWLIWARSAGEVSESRDPGSGTTLLVSPVTPQVNWQVGFFGTSFGRNRHGCIVWGGSVVIGLPGSKLAAGGRAITLTFSDGHTKSYRLGERVTDNIGGSALGIASPGVPAARVTCGASTRFILIQ